MLPDLLVKMAEGVEHVQFYSPPGSEEGDHPPVQADIETPAVVFPEQEQEQETIPRKRIPENKPEISQELSAEEERRQRREDLVHHRQEHLQRSMERLARSMEQMLNERDAPIVPAQVIPRQETPAPVIPRMIPKPSESEPTPRNLPEVKKKQKFAEPAKFSGEDKSWEEYLVTFELCAEWNGWDDEEAFRYLLISLTGDAAIHIYGIPSFRQMDYFELCDALEDRFGSGRTLAEDKRKFRLRKKQKGETYAHMAEDLRRLARRIYRKDTKLAEQEAKEQFLRGLPKNVRLAVTAANPKTLDNCVDNVAQIQTVLESEELEEGIAVKTVKTVKTEQQNSSNSMNKNGNGQSRNRGRDRFRRRGRNRGNSQDDPANNQKGGTYGTSPLRCWTCGEVGHFKNECPQSWRNKTGSKKDRQDGTQTSEKVTDDLGEVAESEE